MKKLALIISCLVPVLSFATNVSISQRVAIFQERCAKEKDPVKRQNSCLMLDKHNGSQTNIADFHKETATV